MKGSVILPHWTPKSVEGGKFGCSERRSNASHIRMFILDRSKNDTSVTLDLLRAVAAQMVCVGHGIAFFMPPAPVRASNHAKHRGADFLCAVKDPDQLHADRKVETSLVWIWHVLAGPVARIYSGLVPALIFVVVVVDGVVIYIFNEKAFAEYYTVKGFVSNLFMFELFRGVFSKFCDGLLSAPPARSGHSQSNGTFTCLWPPFISYGLDRGSAWL